MYDIDETKPVYVNDKNQIFCFRKKWGNETARTKTHTRIQTGVG
jgi:hypothetical protein